MEIDIEGLAARAALKIKSLAPFKWLEARREKRGLQSHLLGRYIARELLLYFGICFLFFFMVFFVNQMLLLAESILKKRVPLAQVARLVVYCMPFVIAQSAPFATLVGFLMCIGRLASQNEVIIIRASGFSYAALIRPVLLLGACISLASFFVNDYLLPLGTIRYNTLYRSILASNPAVELESHSIKKMNNATLVTGNVKGSEVSDVALIDKGSDGQLRVTVSGPSRLFSAREAGVLMRMEMSGAVSLFIDENSRDNYDALTAESATLNIFDSSFFNSNRAVSPREMTSYDLGRRLREMKKDEDVSFSILNRYKLEFNKKFSQPFGSFFFAILALPLALLFGRKNGQTIGMIVGIFISVLYWSMMIVGQLAASRNGFNAFWSMWLPNAVIGGMGAFLYIALKRR